MHLIASARRRPGRSVLFACAALAIAPVAFYLLSPLFVRTTLVEAAPAGVIATASPPATAVASESPTSTDTDRPEPSVDPGPSLQAPVAISTGAFKGTDAVHFGSGTATIIETSPGRHILRLEDFSVLNGPDLYVYLSPDPKGYADEALELGRLKATDGSFNYDLPVGTDPADFASAIIWCKQFSHLFAVASLSAG